MSGQNETGTQILQRFDGFQWRGLQPRKLAQEAGAIGVDADVALRRHALVVAAHPLAELGHVELGREAAPLAGRVGEHRREVRQAGRRAVLAHEPVRAAVGVPREPRHVERAQRARGGGEFGGRVDLLAPIDVAALARGEIETIIERRFPLAEAEEAHRVSKAGKVVGKLLLIP